MIRTKSSSAQGHYRAGVYHSPRGSDWPDDQFDEKQAEAIKADPRLTVEYLDGEPTGRPAALPNAGVSGEDAEYLERKAALEEREQAADDKEADLKERETRVDAREKAFKALAEAPEVREAVLTEAVRRALKRGAKEDLTTDGKLKTQAIEREAPGFEISAKERDDLAAKVQEETPAA